MATPRVHLLAKDPVGAALALCAVGNLLRLYCKRVRPRIGKEDWDDAVPAAFAEGLRRLRQSGGKKPGASLKGVFEGFTARGRATMSPGPDAYGTYPYGL